MAIDINNKKLFDATKTFLIYVKEAIDKFPSLGLTAQLDSIYKELIDDYNIPSIYKKAIPKFHLVTNIGISNHPSWIWRPLSEISDTDVIDFMKLAAKLQAEHNNLYNKPSKKLIIDTEQKKIKNQSFESIIVTPKIIASHEEFYINDSAGNSRRYSYLKNIDSKRILMNENPMLKLNDVIKKFPNFDADALSNQDCIEILLLLNEITEENNMLIKLFANISNILK